jgi:hypothetical protein
MLGASPTGVVEVNVTLFPLLTPRVNPVIVPLMAVDSLAPPTNAAKALATSAAAVLVAAV